MGLTKNARIKKAATNAYCDNDLGFDKFSVITDFDDDVPTS
jgi:hypothetical protein